MTKSISKSLEGDELSLLELITQTAPDAIITIDGKGEILSFSSSAERIFGYTAAEAIGQNVRIIMPEPYRSQHDGYLQRYGETGERRIIGIGRQVRGQRKDGSVFEAELAVGEHETPDGSIFTGFVRDVSERSRALRKVNKLQRALDQVSRSVLLGEMATALAHEISQPLTAISNYATAARRQVEGQSHPDETLVGRLERIAEQAQRAGSIIRRMQRLVYRGTVEAKPEDINEIAREAVALSNLSAIHNELRVEFDFSEGLPPVMADRVQVEQVIINLLRNAAEALEEGAPPNGSHAVEIVTSRPPEGGNIEVRAKRTNHGEVMVTVSDNGFGFPDVSPESIFDPFFTTKETGVGVGLAICRSIIVAHGGRIWAETNGDGGADVHFTLPTAEAV